MLSKIEAVSIFASLKLPTSCFREFIKVCPCWMHSDPSKGLNMSASDKLKNLQTYDSFLLILSINFESESMNKYINRLKAHFRVFPILSA